MCSWVRNCRDVRKEYGGSETSEPSETAAQRLLLKINAFQNFMLNSRKTRFNIIHHTWTTRSPKIFSSHFMIKFSTRISYLFLLMFLAPNSYWSVSSSDPSGLEQNLFHVSVPTRWQLASRRCLLQTACQSGALSHVACTANRAGRCLQHYRCDVMTTIWHLLPGSSPPWAP